MRNKQKYGLQNIETNKLNFINKSLIANTLLSGDEGGDGGDGVSLRINFLLTSVVFNLINPSALNPFCCIRCLFFVYVIPTFNNLIILCVLTHLSLFRWEIRVICFHICVACLKNLLTLFCFNPVVFNTGGRWRG